MNTKSTSKSSGTSRQAEEQHLQETLAVVRENVEKYSQEVTSMRSGIDEMLAHFHDDNPELINELENTYTMYRFLDKTLMSNRRALKKPYFGRIDIQDEKQGYPETFYIGRSGITRDVIHPVVIDWRSPIANTYYENGLGTCSYLSGEGKEIRVSLNLKRTYEIENGKLQNMFDTEVVANDDILTRYLSKNRQAVLGEIVATIQKEQNEIIRKPPYHNCIVQGVAGSGKTTVAMHRISYILYNYEDRFHPEDFYIVGSNRMLLNYITGVLPELDVYGIRQMTMEQLFIRLLYEDWDENKYSIRSTESSGPAGAIKSRLSWFQDLEAFCKRLEQASIPTESIYLNPRQFVEGILDGKTGVHDHTSDAPVSSKDLILLMDCDAISRYISFNPSVSIQSKINMLNERLRIRIKDEFLGKDVRYTEAEQKAISRHFHGYFGGRSWKKTIYDMYRKFLLEQKEKGCSVEIPDNRFDVYDLAALAYLYKRVKETEVISEAHHIVIDEAQDFGMMAYSALNFCIKDCTYTIMGDVSQNIHFGYGLSDWEELKKLYLKDDRASFGILKKSYRNTVEISDFATRILRHGNFAVYPVEPIIRHGSAPQIFSCKNPDLFLKRAAEICRKWQENGLKTIAVICRDQHTASQISGQLGTLIDVLDNSPENASFGSGILVLSVEYTKGLEFDAVLILDPSREDYPVDDGHAKLLYVAATRALHELCVLHTGNLTGLIADPVPEKTVTIFKDAQTKKRPETPVVTVSATRQRKPAAAVHEPPKNTSCSERAIKTITAADQTAKMITAADQSGKPVTFAEQDGKLAAHKRAGIPRSDTRIQQKAGDYPAFGSLPSNELLRPVGHAIPDLSIRWITKRPDGLCLHSSCGILLIRPLRSDSIRITFVKENIPGDACDPLPEGQTPFRKWKYRESRQLVEIKTEQIYLKADRSTGAITFLNAASKPLLEERSREPHLAELPPHNKPRMRLYLNWTKNESLHALGAGTRAELSLKGAARYISHRPNLQKFPAIFSEKGYGIMPLSLNPVFCCDIPTYGPHICMEDTRVLDYCFITGKDNGELLAVCNALTKQIKDLSQ